MKRVCYTCGKESDLMSWETDCYRCRRMEYDKDMKYSIVSGEVKDTYCERDVYCPYCGERNEITGEDEVLDGGEHEFECMSCEKEFIVDTVISYVFSTKRKEIKDNE